MQLSGFVYIGMLQVIQGLGHAAYLKTDELADYDHIRFTLGSKWKYWL